MFNIRTALSVLTEALSEAQQFLSDFLNIFISGPTDAKFYTLVALITVISGGIITWLFNVAARRHKRRERRQQIETHIKRTYITSLPPLPEWTPEQLQREKSQLFLKPSLKTDKVFSYRRFFVEREILNCPALCITKSSPRAKRWRSHSHVNIYGDRGQGKTVVLAALFLRHSTTKGVQLWMKSPQLPTHEDAEYLAQYLKTPKIKSQKFVALFIDDYSRGNDSHDARIAKRNIVQVARAETPRRQTRIIYTVSDGEDNEADQNLHLFLTETEEQSFLRKVACEEPVLVDPSCTDIHYALGLLGGERQYSSDLTSFLSLIIDKLFRKDRVSLPGPLSRAHFDELTWRAIQLIAAVSLGGINTPFPAKLLEKLVRGAKIFELENITERQIVHVHDIGFTTAPYYASRILADVDAAQLEEMYSRVFQACVTENTAKSFDFVQQILYRLAKGRHFTFLEEEKSGKDGKDFAEGLYRSISAKVIEHCCSSESVSTVCSWAAIAARLNRIDQARTLCERLVSLPTAGPLRGNHFVNLAFTQGALLSSMNSTEKSARSDTRDVVDKCLKLLASSFEYAWQTRVRGTTSCPALKGPRPTA